MKYIRTKEYVHELISDINNKGYNVKVKTPFSYALVSKAAIIAQADTIEELIDEVVLIENGNECNIVYLQEAYDRIIEYHEQGNHEPRLIGRIKVGLDKKAVAEWKENEQGLYEWVLL